MMDTMYDDFPHLTGVTPFPVDKRDPAPYEQYRNTFDYTTWPAGTRIKLVVATWDGSSDVIGWGSVAARDEWFEKADGYELVTPQMYRMVGGSVKLPLPYDVNALYNYAWVTFPEAPVERENDNGVRSWGFFVSGMSYLAPNTTELSLGVDWWTTFEFGVSVPSVRLARGHWAVENSADVEAFLADPMGNTDNLMDDESDTVHASEVHDVQEVTWNTGEQLAVFDVGGVDITVADGSGASTAYYPVAPGSGLGEAESSDATLAYTRLVAKEVSRDSDYSYPAEGSAAESGSQGAKSISLSDAHTPFGEHYTSNGNGYGGHLITMYPGDLGSFNPPAWFWHCVRALYFVPARFMALGDEVAFGGVKVREAIGTAAVASVDVALDKADFNYPDEAEAWTKLYTGQYARVRLTVSDGRTMEVPPEQLSTGTSVRTVAQVTSDGMRILMFLSGVGSASESGYVLRRVQERGFAAAGDWQSLCAQFDVPVYEVFQDARVQGEWDNDVTRALDAMRARVNRDNALRSGEASKWTSDAAAWQAWQNAQASNATAAQNSLESADVALQNATTSADAAMSVSKRNADTAKSNTDASADTVKSNTDASADTAKSNADASADVTHDNSYRSLDANLLSQDASARVALSTLSNGVTLSQARTFLNLSLAALKQGTRLQAAPDGSKTNVDLGSFAPVNKDSLYFPGSNLWEMYRKVQSNMAQSERMTDLKNELSDSMTDLRAVSAGVSAVPSVVQGMVSGASTGAALVGVAGAAGGAAIGALAGASGTVMNVASSYAELGIMTANSKEAVAYNSLGAVGTEHWYEWNEAIFPYASKEVTGTTETGYNLYTVGIANLAATHSTYQDWWSRREANMDTILDNNYNAMVNATNVNASKALTGYVSDYSTTVDPQEISDMASQNLSLSIKGAGPDDDTPATYTSVSTYLADSYDTASKTDADALLSADSRHDGSNTKASRVSADRTQSTTKSNATATQSTTKSNATATQSTTKSNASNTLNTSKDNSQLSRDITVRNAQRSNNLVVGGAAAEAAYATGDYSVTEPAWDYAGTARRTQSTANSNAEKTWLRTFFNNQDGFALSTEPNAVESAWVSELTPRVVAPLTDGRKAPLIYGRAGNEASMPEVKPQGVVVRVLRPVDGDLIRFADKFKVFGYWCHRLVTKPDLTLGGRAWSYWLCDRAVVRATNAPSTAARYVQSILESGVTVWSDPDKVGDYE